MTKPPAPRINARLPAAAAEKLAYIQRIDQLSVTDVVVASIDRYYAEVTRERETPAQIFARTGFIGSGDGPPTLSTSYKAELTRSLKKKA